MSPAVRRLERPTGGTLRHLTSFSSVQEFGGEALFKSLIDRTFLYCCHWMCVPRQSRHSCRQNHPLIDAAKGLLCGVEWGFMACFSSLFALPAAVDPTCFSLLSNIQRTVICSWSGHAESCWPESKLPCEELHLLVLVLSSEQLTVFSF